MELTVVQKVVVFAIPVLLAITVHEAAHGYAAKFFGDLTAEKLGRITLNPFKHIDPTGTILVPAIAVMLGGILFGWAKPVPVNYGNLRNPRKNMLWVAAAGPASNFVMAIIWALLLKYANAMPSTTVNFLAHMSVAGISINLVLMVLNLLPMPPLDGGRIAVSLLPNNMAMQLAKIEQYGFFILIALMATGILGQIIGPIIRFFEQIIFQIFI